MKRTAKEVRARCREIFGNEWWDVDPETKRQRQDEAIKTLDQSAKYIPKSVPKQLKQDLVRQDIIALETVVKAISNVKNVSIRRISTSFDECYESLRNTMPIVNELRWLYHGSAPDTVPKIISEGYNRSFCGKNATAYGKGVYFAKDISYSAQPLYSPPDKDGFKCILANKVLVGRSCLGKANQTVPDMFDNTRRYDTTVDSVSNPRIFVVYKDMQAIPEYEIKFKIVKHLSKA